MEIRKIATTPEGVAQARRDSLRRAGVGAAVTPELMRLRAKRAPRAAGS